MLLGALLVGLVVGISASEEGKQWKPLGEQGVFMGNAQEIDGFPSPEEFFTKYVLTHTPVIMRQAAADWPALKRWQDDEYLTREFGDLMMDVEYGKKENRSDPSDAMTLAQFLQRYKLPSPEMYLVHVLPHRMMRDLGFPKPLIVDAALKHLVEINIWFSSGGTKSLLHVDTYENILTLVDGTKQLVLYAPEEVANLHPYEAKILGTGPADVDAVDLDKYPDFGKAKHHLAVLNKGDALYIPQGWFHQVRSFDRNIGVNVWWEFTSVEQMLAAAARKGAKDPERWPYIKQMIQYQRYFLKKDHGAQVTEEDVRKYGEYHGLGAKLLQMSQAVTSSVTQKDEEEEDEED